MSRRPSYAAVVSTVALFFALGGTAAGAKVWITGADVKDGSLTGADLEGRSIGASKLKLRSLTAKELKTGSITSAAIRDGSLTVADVSPRSSQRSGGSGARPAGLQAPQGVRAQPASRALPDLQVRQERRGAGSSSPVTSTSAHRRSPAIRRSIPPGRCPSPPAATSSSS